MQENKQEKSLIKQNILQYIDYKGISKYEFYKVTGITRGILDQNNGISEDNIARFLAYYKDVSVEWLITRNGEMLKDVGVENKNTHLNTYLNTHLSNEVNDLLDKNGIPSSSNIDINKTLSKTDHVEVRLPDLLDNEESLSVPFYDLPVSAGSLGILDFESAGNIIPKGYIQLSVFRGCEYIFPIVGISMEPIIYSGDWVGVKHIETLSRSWDFVQTGVIYLIITNEDRMIKFIERATDEDDYIVCSSPNYKSFKIHKGDILNIYRVKAFARGI